ncbi:MAG: hypothetical protein HY052_01370 [Proteobacteria bacterium]|nr:hypothetical protein [Pseudomonadota bacterium]
MPLSPYDWVAAVVCRVRTVYWMSKREPKTVAPVHCYRFETPSRQGQPLAAFLLVKRGSMGRA